MDTATRLKNEHAKLDFLFDDLLDRADVGEWWLCDEIWDEAVRTLEAHFDFEEEQVFPNLLRAKPAGKNVIHALRAEHASFRKALARIGIELQLHEDVRSSIRDLVEKLKAHAELESRTVYAWLAEAEAGGPFLRAKPQTVREARGR